MTAGSLIGRAIAIDRPGQVRAVIDRALADLQRLGAVVVDPVTIPDLASRSVKLYDGNVFETEAATNRYLAQHPNAPVKTLSEILLSGKVVPSRRARADERYRPLHR